MPLFYYEAGYPIGFALTLGMGILTIFLQPRRREARLWALLSLWVSLWFLARYFVLRAGTAEEARTVLRWAYIHIVLINPTYYHFVLALVRQRKTKLLYFGYATAISLSLINIFSNLLISGVTEGVYFAFYERAGPLYGLELLNYILFPALGVIALIRCRKTANPTKKRQLDYMLAAAAIGFLCGISTMPLVYRLRIPPFAAPLVAIYPLVSTYAILRHHLLDIRIIIRRTLIYSGVTAFLSALYVAVLVIGSRALYHGLAAPTLASSAAAAAIIAILFHPLRVYLDHWVDRRFPRESLDPVLFREATSTFAHEVKGPLVNISLPAQLALQDVQQLKAGANVMDTAEKLERRLQFILEESHDAGEKIEAIRELTGPGRPEHNPLDIRDIVESVASSFLARANKNAVAILIQMRQESLPLRGNRRQLEIALGNLVRNGLEAIYGVGTGGGELTLSGRQEGERIYIQVTDTGAGIPEQDLGRIFAPWFTTKGAKGMGVGLYIAQQIIQRHGGSIEARNRSFGKGSCFYIELPANG